MNANPTNERPEEIRYSYGNLPPSVAEATRRLDEVDENIAKISADLQSKTVGDLGTLSVYDVWKRRATRALAHKRREKTFLLQWISSEQGRLERNQEILSEQDRGDRIQGMVTDFLRSARPYGQPFPQDGKPDDLEAIAARRAELSEIKMDYGAFLSFLKTQSFRIHCPLDYYNSARARIARIVQNAEVEILRLKKLTRDIGAQNPRRGLETLPGQDSKFNPPAQASGDPRLFLLTREIHKVKNQIGMNSSLMTAWLYDLTTAHIRLSALSPEQIMKLDLIGRYVELTKERQSIEFPRQG